MAVDPALLPGAEAQEVEAEGAQAELAPERLEAVLALEVELAALDAWAAEGRVPPEAARACRERASFTVEAVNERERTTGHGVTDLPRARTKRR